MKLPVRLAVLSGLLALFGATSALSGCAAPTADDETGKSGDEVMAESIESALSGSIRHLGEIPGTGEARVARYTPPPRYVSFALNVNGGDEVDVRVAGEGRADAMAWLLDPRGRLLASNDDARGERTLDSRIVTKVPASLGTKAQLRIVFREYSQARATFSVTARVKPGMFACTTDVDCAKVSRGGCCTGWMSIAVNASRTEDYAAQNLCKPPYPPCAPPPRDDRPEEVARCEAGACVLGAPRGCTYGGAQHAVGDSFPSTDGCNTCTCGESGAVGCTKRACAPTCDPAAEPNRKYRGNPEQCMLMRFACDPGTSYFSSACGCGCEQPSDCPAFINCMPGPGVPSCGPARARCPFTPVAY
ncbi:MAG: hypothetical protein IPF92_07140 [Myxococcales bacterium]|jgi:hypothetical protein|nr:hypothetical protein [Myxococcales bacterium]HQY64530.1 hypothetical protein [Polyangiaceae bacterium]